ncbi:hypothetical protein IAQ61_000534 [Plenodomus lingam]|uniref:uncharacterized protein n=1 Tax=Leptosphaeria maculans TaxID=5022 RepID=UPI00331B945B|nr:hypothetical protein IAQ61_000534 [Plenodomus lingam]
MGAICTVTSDRASDPFAWNRDRQIQAESASEGFPLPVMLKLAGLMGLELGLLEGSTCNLARLVDIPAITNCSDGLVEDGDCYRAPFWDS